MRTAHAHCMPVPRFALRSNRPHVIRMVCEAYLLREYVGQRKFLSARELGKLLDNTDDQATLCDILIDIYAAVETEMLVGGIQADFRTSPGQTLYDLIDLASRSDRKSKRMSSYDSFTASDLTSSSVKLQLAAAGCLHAIGSQKDALGRFEYARACMVVPMCPCISSPTCVAHLTQCPCAFASA